MVTRTVIRISPTRREEAAADDDAASSSSSSSDDKHPTTTNAPPKTNKSPLCNNHLGCTQRAAQHPSPLCWKHGAQGVPCKFTGCNKRGILLGLCADHGGMVQLCRWGGCIQEVDFERGGLCPLHQVNSHDGDNNSSEEDEGLVEEEGKIRLCRFRGCICDATAGGGGLCTRHSPYEKNISLKRVSVDDKQERPKRKRQQNNSCFVVDLTGVPPQPPIPKRGSHVKDGASKYTGVSLHKASGKWLAQIRIDGKVRSIGGSSYENEEEAAVDYARAVYKYKGQTAQQNLRQNPFVDLTDVPPQPLILKNDLLRSKEYCDNTRRRNVKKGSSKYTGVYFEKQMNKWKAQIMIEGIVRSIGYYVKEEEAAADYARAVFKYKPKKKNRGTYGGLDLSDIPDQPLIQSETAKSGYKGVKKNKSRWEATINGKNLGTFDTKEEAAGIYARARYYCDEKGGELLKKKKQRVVEAVSEQSVNVVSV